MKKFFKLFLTLEHPIGEMWLTIVVAVILYALGFFDFGTLWELVVIALLFGLVLMLIFFISYKWRHRKKENKVIDNH